MFVSAHLVERVKQRFSAVADPTIALAQLQALEVTTCSCALVLYTSAQKVTCSDGSNGYYFVAICRDGKAVTACWTRHLNLHHLRVDRVVQL